MAEGPYWGQHRPQSATSAFNRQWFMVDQLLKRINTATLVKVGSITNTGGVEPVGTMSVVPLVNMIDGANNKSEHGTVNNIMYSRLHGGTSAVILDPKVGDVGLVVFADRDTTAVRSTKDKANPGSRRRFDMADGVWVMTVLAAAPTSYIQFEDDGTITMSPDDGNSIAQIKKDKITLTLGAKGSSPMVSTFTPTRIDLAGLGGSRVETEAGPSNKVFAVL